MASFLDAIMNQGVGGQRTQQDFMRNSPGFGGPYSPPPGWEDNLRRILDKLRNSPRPPLNGIIGGPFPPYTGPMPQPQPPFNGGPYPNPPINWPPMQPITPFPPGFGPQPFPINPGPIWSPYQGRPIGQPIQTPPQPWQGQPPSNAQPGAKKKSMSDIMEGVMERFQNIQNPQLPTQQGMNMNPNQVNRYKQNYQQSRTQAYGARTPPRF